jgi:hypothetical protein
VGPYACGEWENVKDHCIKVTDGVSVADIPLRVDQLCVGRAHVIGTR